MFDLSHEMCEAKQSLESWKWLYDRRSYPHVIVENMMRRVYTMDLIWMDYESKLLRDLPGFMATYEMESYYCKKVVTDVDPNLKKWMDVNRSRMVGCISYSYWDGLATSAEDNDNILEEIEFSYIFHFLLDKCVLYWIALCLSGNDPKSAMGIISGRTIVDNDEYSYEKMKYFFQEHYIRMYMRDYMPEGSEKHSCIFAGDKFSQPTSNLSEYICRTPELCAFIEANPSKDFYQLLREYESHLYAKGQLTALIRTRVCNIVKRYDEILNNLQKLEDYDISAAQNDMFDIEEYNRRLLKNDEMINYFSFCSHPYVCAELAEKFLSLEYNKDKGFVYLQKALIRSFSFPNPFWNNQEAIYGCAKAIDILREHMTARDIIEFENLFKISLFKIQYLLCKRALYLNKNSCMGKLCKSMLAAIISQNYEVLLEYGISASIASCYTSKLLNEIICTNGEYYLAEILLRQFDNHVLNLYWVGNMHIEESVLADLVRFIQLGTENEIDWSNFYLKAKFRVIDTSNLIVQNNVWVKTFTESEQRCISIATLKDSVSDYERFFVDNGIEYLYHFTDRANLESIKSNGGLWSCQYLKKNQIHTFPGGDEELQKIDQAYGLDDYVRLSFCKRHPMGWRLKMNKNKDFVILKIQKEVAFSQETLFSDVNAATPEHRHGGGLDNLMAVNLEAVNAKYTALNSTRLEQTAAEVMVKTNIPLKYILNLENPESF